MKHLLLAFVLTIAAIATTHAQNDDVFKSQDWYVSLEIDDDGYLYGASNEGIALKGKFQDEDLKGDLAFFQSLNKDNDVIIEFILGSIPFPEDTDVKVDVIVNGDITDMKQYAGFVYNDAGSTEIFSLDTEGADETNDMYGKLFDGGHVQIKVYTDDSENVYQYSLEGFQAVDARADSILLKPVTINNFN